MQSPLDITKSNFQADGTHRWPQVTRTQLWGESASWDRASASWLDPFPTSLAPPGTATSSAHYRSEILYIELITVLCQILAQVILRAAFKSRNRFSFLANLLKEALVFTWWERWVRGTNLFLLSTPHLPFFAEATLYSKHKHTTPLFSLQAARLWLQDKGSNQAQSPSAK